MKATIWAVLALVISTTSVSAQEFDTKTSYGGPAASWLRIDSDAEFTIGVGDGVTHGCWRNAKAIKSAIALELTRSSYKVIEESSLNSFDIWISGTGSEIVNGTCVVAYELLVYRHIIDRFIADNHRLSSIVPAIMWRGGGVRWASKGEINQHLKEGYVNLIQEFLIGIPGKQKEALKNIGEFSAASSEAKTYWSNFKVK